MIKLYIVALSTIDFEDKYFVFKQFPYYLVFAKESEVKNILAKNAYKIKNFYIDTDTNNALFDYDNLSIYNARIEKGAVIRKNVEIDDSAIILMGAIINIGAKIGANTMIDMNAVIGSGAIIKNNVHISAGVVISGVLEPISTSPVIIEDNVFIGANTVIKEGVHIEKGAIIGANSYVSKDISAYTLNYGTPCKFIRYATKEDYEKLKLNPTLRNNLNQN